MGGDGLTHASLVIQSERGRKSGRRKIKQQKRLEKRKGGFDAVPKLGQIHFPGLIPTKVFILIRRDEGGLSVNIMAAWCIWL